MYQPKTIYAKLALETIIEYVTYNTIKELDEIPKELTAKQACFVSIHNADDDSLRGCIGTIEPATKNLVNEIIRNAISAATKDSRFHPLTETELENITVSVDVLSIPKPGFSLSGHLTSSGDFIPPSSILLFLPLKPAQYLNVLCPLSLKKITRVLSESSNSSNL